MSNDSNNGKNSDDRKEKNPKRSAAVRAMWQNPEYRAKLHASLKLRWQDPEYRARISRNWHSCGTQLTPDFAAKQAAIRKEAWADPEYKARVSDLIRQGTTAAWADPERKAARLQKRRATLAAKKAALKDKP